MGIHGEPGAHVSAVQPVSDVVRRLLDSVCNDSVSTLALLPGAPVALLVNGLGTSCDSAEQLRLCLSPSFRLQVPQHSWSCTSQQTSPSGS